jgi:hypothetical protein
MAPRRKPDLLPAPPVSPDPAAIRFLHVRCLRPGCGHDAVIDAAKRFAGRALPPPGLSRRFVCECGARTAHVSHETRKPKRENGCGGL